MKQLEVYCVLLFSVLCAWMAASFAVPVATTRSNKIGEHPPSTFLLLSSKSDAVEEKQEKKKGEKEVLIFRAEIDESSDSLPDGTSRTDALAFLRKPESRNMLLSAGGTRPVNQVAMTEELNNLWKECCNHYGTEYLPEGDDVVLACDSITKFPGLELTTTIYNGVKLAKSEEDSSPHTFLLIGESQSASGLLKDVFNKLTGNDKKGDSLRPSGLAKSVVSVKEDDGNNLKFHFDASIEIKVQFAAFLLKILPVSKEKAEKQGSAAINKSITKDAEKTMRGIYEAYSA